ncbi:MAG: Ribosomal RNA small subunit methyltransferase B [Bacteroidota bacterium]|nr:MAG: Ribosomal RNA small subunit methyltransferase B [Bacteroidota bacterium]
MRLHKNLVLAVLNGLHQIFNEEKYADKVVAQVLKSDKRWGSRDRGFIAETSYEIVRWKRLYATIADVQEPLNRDDLWRIFAVWATLRGYPLPDWKPFEGTPTRRIKGRFETLRKERKYRESVPDWLDELAANSLGEKKWEKELEALNTVAPVVLRANALKILPKLLRNALLEDKITTQYLSKYPDALVLDERSNVFSTEAFQKGLFEVQDAASQCVAPFTQVESGMRVIDACAGAGGKSLHLAALMQNKGQLIALDIHQYKLRELKRRAKRAGAHNIETRLIENNKIIKKLHGSADRVLLDAPCSGLGVLRRNPDAKWKLNPDFINRVIAEQQKILTQYAHMVKPGGKLIYVTCSILPQENEAQISEFLTTEIGQSFTLEKESHFWPSVQGFDGFYMARLERKV